jgi:protein ImuA
LHGQLGSNGIPVDTFSLFEALPVAPAVPVPMSAPLPPARPLPCPAASAAAEDLHPALWRAAQVGHQPQLTWPSGFVALDAELPGAGWPAGALTELLLPHAGIGEMRLLAPVLAAVQQRQRCVMLFDPPAALCGWALGALGVDVRQLVLVQGGAPFELRRPARGPRQGAPAARASHTLWALEQALKSGHVGALLAWLPARLPADALRRLQLAAQAHDGPAFVLREAQAGVQPSAAPLRLRLAPAGPDELALQIVKRRGPQLLQPLRLALPPVLSAPVRRRALHHAVPALPVGEGAATVAPAPAGVAR